MAPKLQDLIDIEQFQMLQDRLNEIYAFPSAIIDNNGVVLTATAWQEVCTRFHRRHPEALKVCIQSDRYIAEHLHEARPYVSYRCPHGLTDNATPIIIDGVHYGNFFTGQFFLEPPDLESFRTQARRYGFDEEAYLEAVRKVPVWTQAQLDSYLFFIKGLIEVISSIGLKNLREIRAREAMRASEAQFRTLLRTALDGFLRIDREGRILESNDAYCRMSGYGEEELLALGLGEIEAVESAEAAKAHIAKIAAEGGDRFETRHRRKDGTCFDVEVSAQFQPIGDGQTVAFVRDITERKRVEAQREQSRREMERLADEMALIAEIGRIAGSTLELQQVYERVAIEARKLIPYDRFLVNRLQDDGQAFLVAFETGTPNPRRQVGQAYPCTETVTGSILATGKSLLLQPDTPEEVQADFPFQSEAFRMGLQSTLGVPLVFQDRVIGILAFRSKQRKAYTDRDLRLAERIGTQVAGAIANAQLYADLQAQRQAAERLAEEQATLAEIGRVVGSTLDLEQVYRQVAHEVGKLIPNDRFMICRRHPQREEFSVTYAEGDDNAGRRVGDLYPTRGTAFGLAVARRAGVLVQPEDPEEIRDRYRNLYETFLQGLRSTMVIPLIAQDRVIGSMNIRSRKIKAYSERDLRLAERIGTQVAGAIANAQLYADLEAQRRAAERLAEEQAVLAEIGRVIGSSPEVSRVYEGFAAEARRLIPFDGVSVSVVEPDGKAVTITYVSGIDIPERRTGQRVPLSGTFTALAVRQRTPLIFSRRTMERMKKLDPDLETDLSPRSGVHTNMVIPLLDRDRVIGTLHFRAGRDDAYREEDLRLANRIGMQIAGAVANAQLYTDVERQRRAAEQLAAEQAVLAEIGRVIGSTPEIARVYEQFAAITRRVIPFDALSINLIDLAQNRFLLAYLSGSPVPGRQRGNTFPLAGSLTGHALALRKGFVLGATSEEAMARLYPTITSRVSLRAGFLSNLLIPLFSGDTAIGVLHFRAHREGAYGEAELRLAERIGMQIAGAIANAQLFEELRGTERALRESEERFRLAFATSPDAVSINRLSDGRYEDVNEGFTRLTGFTREEVLGRTTGEVNLWIDPEALGKLLAGLREKGFYENLEATFRRKDGTEATALMSAKLLLLLGVKHVLSITRDISDRKRAAEEQARLQEQLLQAQKMESVGRLAGGVAHDFNNMLGVILGHLEMALEAVPPEEPLHEDLRQIEKAARRSADLTRQLLAFARKQPIAPKVLDLNETVEEGLKMLRRLIGEDIQLAWIPGSHLWPVRMDPSQIDQILANLCVNARDAIAGVGRITIETGNVTLQAGDCVDRPDALPGDYVIITVSDTGCGMDKATLRRLFEPFFTTKAFGKGTGLGLATLYGIVRQNNGFIDVASEPGRGSTFRVFLPQHRGESEGTAPEASEKTVATLRGGETVLIVEDEVDLLDLAQLMLQRQGYEVLAAATPGEALRLAQTHGVPIDLLVTDVIMPEMNGRDLARQIAALHPGIKCLFTSGYTADVIAHHGVLDRETFFIQKPFTRMALAAKVREVLEQG